MRKTDQEQLNPTNLIFAAVPAILACAGLGAFGGCNMGMVQAARGGMPNFLMLILFCTILGFLIGLIASFWDKYWAKQCSPVRRRFALRFGYACTWLLLAILSFQADWTKAHNWTPIKIPIRFDRADFVSATFTA